MANSELFKIIDGKRHLLNPKDGKYYPVEDVYKTNRFAASNEAKTPERLAFERAFEERRGIRCREGADGGGPVPGGAGYGVIYSPACLDDFKTGTSITVDILCPQTAGGNSGDCLYLTETNRAMKGVEALVAYLEQAPLEFDVYDWAKKEEEDRWALTLDADQLAEYLGTKTLEGISFQYLSLQNVTYMPDTKKLNQWKNEVFLFNMKESKYASVYAYEYTATEAEQKDRDEAAEKHLGDWGPVVETFQDSYKGTNPMGFDDIWMKEQNADGNWSVSYHLTKDNSHIREDHKGFSKIFLKENYSFAVKS